MGMFFLPEDEVSAECIKGIFEQLAKSEGFQILGWRAVPCHGSHFLGAKLFSAGDMRTGQSLMVRALAEEHAEEQRKERVVEGAMDALSQSELRAVKHIVEELEGNEGVLVASKIADRVGITRSVIVNALRKLESAGIIISRSSGMKGTYIRIVNEYLFDALERMKIEG